MVHDSFIAMGHLFFAENKSQYDTLYMKRNAAK